MTKKIAVILSGCGYLDGSEITEAVSCLIALTEVGVEPTCFAPNQDLSVTQHIEKKKTDQKRNVLEESARIARSEVQDLKNLRESDFDAVILPGGFGAALNLSNWANEGANTRVHPDVMRVITEFHKASKPIGAACIAPTLVAKVLGSEGVNLTIGDDLATAKEIEKTGARHVKCAVTDYVSDRDHKVITTPAYMYGSATPAEVFTGVRKMIREVVEMA